MAASIQSIELAYSARTWAVLLRNVVIGEVNDGHSHTGERGIVKVGAADAYYGGIRSASRSGISYRSVEGYRSSVIGDGYRERIPAK